MLAEQLNNGAAPGDMVSGNALRQRVRVKEAGRGRSLNGHSGQINQPALESDHSPSKQTAAVVACCEWAKSGENRFTRAGGEPGSPPRKAASVHQMAKDADVSERTIQQAKAAHAAGLGDQVRDGKLTAKRAAAVGGWFVAKNATWNT